MLTVCLGIWYEKDNGNGDGIGMKGVAIFYEGYEVFMSILSDEAISVEDGASLAKGHFLVRVKGKEDAVLSSIRVLPDV